MLEQRFVQRAQTQDNGKVLDWPEPAVPLEEVLRLINRLGRADMLMSDLTPPREWILWSEVPEAELANALHQRLSKAGWRQIVAAMHRHNRETDSTLWDLALPRDFIQAAELALTRWEESSGNKGAAAVDWVSRLDRQVRDLMQEQLEPAGVTTWLLSPRALVSRLTARARRARTETQIKSAVSEAALHTARMVGTDTERDVALKRVEQLREQLEEQLRVFCEENGLPVPRPYSREEAYCLHLLNAYFVTMAEAEGTIARRGAALARRQINLEGQRAETRMDGRLLPELLEGRRESDPLRESLLRERMRHRLALLIGGAIGALGGGLWAVLESISEVLVAGIARYAVVVAPALLIGLMTLVAQTLAYSGPLTLGVAGEFLARALWNGALGLGAAILVYGCWLYYTAQRRGQGT